MVDDDGPPAGVAEQVWQSWGRSPVPAREFAERLRAAEAQQRTDETVRQAVLRLSAVERDLELALRALGAQCARADRAEAELILVQERAAIDVEAAARQAALRLSEVAQQIALAEERLRLVEGSRTWRARSAVVAVTRRFKR